MSSGLNSKHHKVYDRSDLMDVTRAYVFLLIRLSFRMNSIWKAAFCIGCFKSFQWKTQKHTLIHIFTHIQYTYLLNVSFSTKVSFSHSIIGEVFDSKFAPTRTKIYGYT